MKPININKIFLFSLLGLLLLISNFSFSEDLENSEERKVVSSQAIDLLKSADQKYMEAQKDIENANELYTEAQKIYEEAIEIEETFAEAYNNLGVLFLKKGNTEEAKKNFETAYKYEKKNPKIIYNNALMDYNNNTHNETTENNLSEAFTMVNKNPIYSDDLKISVSILLSKMYLEEYLQSNITGTIDDLYEGKNSEIKVFFTESEHLYATAVLGFINHQLNRQITGLELYKETLDKISQIPDSEKTADDKELQIRLLYNIGCLAAQSSDKRKESIDNLQKSFELAKDLSLAQNNELKLLKEIFGNLESDPDLSSMEFEIEFQNLIKDYNQFISDNAGN